MEIKARQKNNVIILDISGAIDVNAADLVDMVSRCIHDGYDDILLNFEDVGSLDYMGVSVLVIAYKQVVNNKGRMKLTCVPAHLIKILDIAGVNKTIEIYATEQKALDSFKSDRAIDEIRKMPLRRRFKRLPVGIKGLLWSKFDPSSCAEKVTVMNVSAIGAYVYGCSKFKLSDEVKLRLKLLQTKEEIELEAKVVWLPDQQVQHRIHPGMGIEFHTIDTEVQQKLLRFIERNLSTMTTD